MKSRTTLILLVLVLLVAGIVYLDFHKGTTTEQAQEKRKRLLNVIAEDVTALELARSNQTIIVEKSGDRWDIKQPLAVRASASAVSAILGEIEFAERDRTLTEGELKDVDLAGFGLVPPRLRVAVRTKNTTVALLIGGETPTTDGIYVQVEGQKTVHIANKALHEQLNKTLNDVRDRTLVEFSPAAATRIEIKNAQRIIELQRAAAATDAEPRWALTRPLPSRADQAKVSSLLTALTGLRALDFVSEDPKDLHAYGLDEPEHEVSVWMGGAETGKTVLLGRALTNDATKVYAKLKGADSIVTVPASEAGKFTAQLNDLRDRRLFSVPATEISAVDIQRGADALALQRDDTGWKALTKPDGKEVRAAQALLDQLLAQLTGLTAKEFTADVSTELDKFGLASPGTTVTLRGAATNILAQLLVGAENAAASVRYVKRADEAFVYGIETNALDQLPNRALDIRDRRVSGLNVAEITKLTLARREGAVVLERGADNAWKLVEPAQGAFDNDGLTALLDTLAQLEAQQFVREGLEQLAEYGLDRPELTLIARVGDKSWTLGIGAPAALGTRYASWNDPPLVFTISPPVAAALTRTIFSAPVAEPSGTR
jgi:hypothetical protein